MPSGKTYAADCARLKAMVHSAYAGAALVPKVVCGDWECDAEPGDTAKPGWWQTVDGLNAAATAGPQSSTVDALSLHWYPASSHDKHDAKEDMNATRLDKFSEVFRRFRKDIAPGWTGEVWAGETASLQNGGGSGVSDRFQSTTWLYDQLGQQGDVGVSRMLRESVSVSNYATVNGTTGEPFPDFFSTVLWRRVVGSRVLAPMHGSARVDNRGKDLRVYSRCARTSETEVVVIVVNLSSAATSMLTLQGAEAGSTKKEWLLTAGNAKAHGTDVWDWGRSDEIALNGAVLKLSATGDAPPMAPKETAATQPVAIAPLSVALLQYTPAAGATACAGSHTVPSKTDDDAGSLPCDIRGSSYPVRRGARGHARPVPELRWPAVPRTESLGRSPEGHRRGRRGRHRRHCRRGLLLPGFRALFDHPHLRPEPLRESCRARLCRAHEPSQPSRARQRHHAVCSDRRPQGLRCKLRRRREDGLSERQHSRRGQGR